jgi:CarD family transcriptional regulator
MLWSDCEWRFCPSFGSRVPLPQRPPAGRATGQVRILEQAGHLVRIGCNVGGAHRPAGITSLDTWPWQSEDFPFMTMSKPLGFEVGDYVVYPKHGVGRVVEIQHQEIAGIALDLFVLRFEKERMTLRVPMNKVESVGMRKLSSQATMNEALTTLKGKPRIKRTMWSRRAQEYEAKINSGDLVSIAEVVRDLHRAEDQPEQSYSERQIYEAAIGRLARELAAMENIDEPAAQQKIEQVLKAA